MAYYIVSAMLVARRRALRCSNVSPANCGSFFTSTLYRETIIESTATDSVSANPRPIQPRGPPLKGMNASRE